MNKVTSLLKKGNKIVKDFDLISTLNSEIAHEKSSITSLKYTQSGSLGDFVLDWDFPQTRDMILRRKCESGEEVSVSALLEGSYEEGSNFLWKVLMKVCIKKPGASSVLQFDCRAYDSSSELSAFDICHAYYLPSTAPLDLSIYRGPPFRSLNLGLQDELKNYLISKGIRKELIDFIISHIHKKEQGQYVSWLQKLQEMVGVVDDQTETS